MYLKIYMKTVILLIIALICLSALNAELVVYIDQPDYHITNHDEIVMAVKVEGVATEMRGYQIGFSFDPQYLEIDGLSAFEEGGFLYENGRTEFYATGENGQYEVACAILGLTYGSLGSGTLFTVRLRAIHSTDELGTDVLLSDIILRDPLNNEILEDRVDHSNVVIEALMMYCKVKAFLHGPYLAGGSMRHSIESYIPLTSPYNAEEIVSVLPDVAPNYIVDWVYIQIREIYNGPIVQSQSAFLLDNGLVVDIHGDPSISFECVDQLSHYIIVKHRNHLGIMSAAAYEFNLDPYLAPLIDLTVLGSVYGGNILGIREVETGVLAMYAGDSNVDGSVNNIDWVLFWRVQNGMSGYIPSDYNLSGLVDNIDWVFYWRINTGRSSQIP